MVIPHKLVEEEVDDEVLENILMTLKKTRRNHLINLKKNAVISMDIFFWNMEILILNFEMRKIRRAKMKK